MLPVIRTDGSLLQRAAEAVKIVNHLVDDKSRGLAIWGMNAMAKRLLSGSEYKQVINTLRNG